MGMVKLKYTVRLRVVLVPWYQNECVPFHQTFQLSVYKLAKWVRTNVFETKMQICVN